MIRLEAPIALLAGCFAGCSLQNFDALGSGADGLDPLGVGDVGGAAGAGMGGAGTGGAGQGEGGAGAAGAAWGGSAGSGAGGGGAAGGSVPAPVEGNGGGAAEGGSGNDVGSGGNAGSAVAPSADAGVGPNLFSDPGFEVAHVGWVGFGDSSIVDVVGEGLLGSRCISSVDRTETFEGPSHRLEALVQPGESYLVEASVRTGAGAAAMRISLKQACEGSDETYPLVATGSANNADWLHLEGTFTVPAAASCTLTEYLVYIEGPESGVSFFVDDVGLYLAQ